MQSAVLARCGYWKQIAESYGNIDDETNMGQASATDDREVCTGINDVNPWNIVCCSIFSALPSPPLLRLRPRTCRHHFVPSPPEARITA